MLNNLKDKISFATPVWNERDGIERYLESCLQFSDILGEVCIVDHRSSDGSGDIVKEYIPIYEKAGITLKLEREERDFDREFTFADIRNRTMDMCSNKFIFFHDADFVFGPGYRTLIDWVVQRYMDNPSNKSFAYPIPVCRNILQMEGQDIRNLGYTKVHAPVHRVVVKGAGRWEYRDSYEYLYDTKGELLTALSLDKVIPSSLLSIDIKDARRSLQRTTMNIYMQNRDKLGDKPWLESDLMPAEDLSMLRPSKEFPDVELEGQFKLDIGKFTRDGKYYQVSEPVPEEINIEQDPWELLDHVYYINLDKRTDRREQVEAELASLGIPSDKLTRISAADHTKYESRSMRGAGCTKSHLQVWHEAVKRGHSTFLVIEDDFELTMSPEQAKATISTVFALFPSFTVCNLGYSTRNSKGANHDIKYGFKKCMSVQTTSAYMIRAEALPMLIPIVNHSYSNLMNNQNYHLNAIDQVWKYVQRIDNRWILAPKISKQRDSYSDIEAINTNYGT